MKQKIFDGLKVKYPDIQDSILNRIAEKLAKTVTTEEQVETAVDGTTIQHVIESYTESRVSEATGTAISNYEKKHNLKEGKPVEPGQPAGGKKPKKEGDEKPEDDDAPAWAKTLIENNKKLEEKLRAIEGEKTVTSRTKKLETLMDEIQVPEKLRGSYRKSIQKMNFETDEEFEGYLTEMKADIEPIIVEMNQKGVVFQTPPSGKSTTPSKDPSKEVKERIEERSAEAQPASSVIKGLPNQSK